jgi:hypothetical protein
MRMKWNQGFLVYTIGFQQAMWFVQLEELSLLLLEMTNTCVKRTQCVKSFCR